MNPVETEQKQIQRRYGFLLNALTGRVQKQIGSSIENYHQTPGNQNPEGWGALDTYHQRYRRLKNRMAREMQNLSTLANFQKRARQDDERKKYQPVDSRRVSRRSQLQTK